MVDTLGVDVKLTFLRSTRADGEKSKKLETILSECVETELLHCLLVTLFALGH